MERQRNEIRDSEAFEISKSLKWLHTHAEERERRRHVLEAPRLVLNGRDWIQGQMRLLPEKLPRESGRELLLCFFLPIFSLVKPGGSSWLWSLGTAAYLQSQPFWDRNRAADGECEEKGQTGTLFSGKHNRSVNDKFSFLPVLVSSDI